jgi:hypothetical protein
VAGLIATVAIGALVAAQFSSTLDHKIGRQPLTPRGHAAIARAKQLTLGRPPVAGLPPREAATITIASGDSSLQAFRVGIGAAGALVIVAGPIGAAGIRNPSRVVKTKQGLAANSPARHSAPHG